MTSMVFDEIKVPLLIYSTFEILYLTPFFVYPNVDVICNDFTKAFDKINYQIVFTKLKQIGICGSFLSWIISFIKDHQQIVAKENWSIPIGTCNIGGSSRVPFSTNIIPYIY